MGIIKCEIHGQTGTVLISPDIENRFLTNQKPVGKIFQIKTVLFGRVVNFCWLSLDFVEKFNIPVNTDTLSLDDLPNDFGEEFLSLLVPMCGECFNEWVNGDE